MNIFVLKKDYILFISKINRKAKLQMYLKSIGKFQCHIKVYLSYQMW